MKRFRVYLKDNRTIEVTADHFTWNISTGEVMFFKSKDEKDDDILIWPRETVAIVPFTSTVVSR
jgi:hypothetical protein